MKAWIRLFITSWATCLTLAAAPAFAALTPYDTPSVTCEGATLSSVTLRICGGTSGAPAGVTLQWKKRADFDASAWADDGTLCKLSLSGQPSLQNPGKSRWELGNGECEDITIGDVNFDETGVSGQDCGLDALDCGTEYVFRWFAHAGRGFGRSDWGGEITCSTAPCPPSRCTYTQGYWRTHGPVGCVAGNNSNQWPAAIMSGGMDLGTRHYSAAQLCQILNSPAAGKGLIALAHQLISAKMNLANGATSCASLVAAISSADAAVGSVDLIVLANGDCSGPPSSRPAGCGAGVPSANTDLTAYNEGGLCLPNCHGDSAVESSQQVPSSPTTTIKKSWAKVKASYR